MAKMDVTLINDQDGEAWPAEVILDKPVGTWISQWLAVLGLPRHEKGKPLAYALIIERSGKTVSEADRLKSFDIEAGETLRLVRTPQSQPKIASKKSPWRVVGILAGILLAAGLGILIFLLLTGQINLPGAVIGKSAATPTPELPATASPQATLTLTATVRPTGTATLVPPTPTPIPLIFPQDWRHDPFAGPIPEGAVARIGKGSSSGVSYSPDGNNIAVNTTLGIYIYDKDFSQVETFLPHEKLFYSSPFWSPDGRRVAGIGYEHPDPNQVHVWEIDSGESIQFSNEYDTLDIAWSPDGSQIAAACYEEKVVISDAATGETLQVLEAHSHDYVNAIDWSPDGTRLASGSIGDVIIWDAQNWEVIQHFEEKDVLSLSWSPDGKKLAAGTYYTAEVVTIWDAGNWTILEDLRMPSDCIESVAWSPDGSMLAAGAEDGVIMVWEANSYELVQSLSGMQYDIKVLSWSGDASILAAVDRGGIYLWDTADWDIHKRILGHSDLSMGPGVGAIFCVAWSPDGTKIAIGSGRGVDVWDGRTGEMLFQKEIPSVYSLAWSPDGGLLASAGFDQLNILDGRSGETIYNFTCGRLGFYQGCHNTALDWSPEGDFLVGKSVSVFFWTSKSGFDTIEVTNFPDTYIELSPDGRFLLGADIDGNLSILDLSSLQIVRTFTSQFEASRGITWSPDGKQFASAIPGGVIEIWDFGSSELKFVFGENPLGEDDISRWVFDGDFIDWSPDGRFIAFCGAYMDLMTIWDYPTGNLVNSFKSSNYGVAWSPDSRLLAAGDGGTTVIWDISQLE